ncbi:hypothetical protein GKG82_08125 [Salmonella enterica]|nr:hypothetical protein [Salmonella enterica subsp. enterica serovar Singapore]EAA4014734.1 hypothetical protein [Salmonella enterica subsp. enterica serovar Newport]EAA9297531.1 hypothetical protein [Salmonella enterica subsp. enterica serovar Enteritidis]EAB4411024.1 hypothetical protein [Salmonella enterica]EBM9900023.1 hypothetical protein [Salmonella enterica subsp. enterica serovar Typhimurium]EBV5763692.1 hypothetical protein [Salmonella enterica subsp. enterica serovar Hvittingfoss]EB
MRKIYIYGENPVVITVMRDSVKDFLSAVTDNKPGSSFYYSGVIRDADMLLDRVQKAIHPPVVLLSLQPGNNILLLQALREIRSGVGIAVFCRDMMYTDRVVARWFNCTLYWDTDVVNVDMGKYLNRAVKKGMLRYRKETDNSQRECLVAELTRRLTRTVSHLDYVLHISLLSEALTKKERMIVSYLREGRSLEQTAALTRAGTNSVSMWYRNLCDRLGCGSVRSRVSEEFMLSVYTQNNPFMVNMNKKQSERWF